MKLRWTEHAVNDLERIFDYLFEQTPARAQRIALQIYQAPERLIQFPFSGRQGRLRGTRELALTSLPYIIVYRVTEETLHILRIVHGAQKYP